MWYDNAEWISPFDNNTTAPGGQNEDGEDAWIAINDLGGTVGGGSGSGDSNDIKDLLSQLMEKVNGIESNMSNIRYEIDRVGNIGTLDMNRVIVDDDGTGMSSFTLSKTPNTYVLAHPGICVIQARSACLIRELQGASTMVQVLWKHTLSDGTWGYPIMTPIMPKGAVIEISGSIGNTFSVFFPVDRLIDVIDKSGSTTTTSSDPSEEIQATNTDVQNIVQLDIPSGKYVRVRTRSINSLQDQWTTSKIVTYARPFFFLKPNTKFFLWDYPPNSTIETESYNVNYTIYTIKDS